MFFIIDVYSKFQNNSNVRMIFSLYGKQYCIREIDALEWGQPIFKEKDLEDDYSFFQLYTTFEEAQQYVHNLKKIEGTR